MSVVRVGSTQQYSDNWGAIFGDTKSAKKKTASSKKKATKKSAKKKVAKKTTKKTKR